MLLFRITQKQTEMDQVLDSVVTEALFMLSVLSSFTAASGGRDQEPGTQPERHISNTSPATTD